MDGQNLFILPDIVEHYLNTVHGHTKRNGEPNEANATPKWDTLKIEQKGTKFENFKKSPEPKEAVLYETVIEAGSGDSNLKLNVKKKSVSRAVFDMKKGIVAAGRDIPFEFPPDYKDIENVLHGRAGLYQDFKLKHSSRNEIESEMEWEIEASVNVKEGTNTKFTVLLHEMDCEADFLAEVYVSGKVHSVANVDGRVRSFEPKDIVEIVRDFQKSPHALPKHIQSMIQLVEIRGKKVVVPIAGHCSFKYGISTKIISKPIPADD